MREESDNAVRQVGLKLSCNSDKIEIKYRSLKCPTLRSEALNSGTALKNNLLFVLSNNGYFGGFLSCFCHSQSLHFLYLPIKTSLFSKHCIQFSVSPAFSMQQIISVWVRDPRIRKNDFWHAYIDYEICLHVSKTQKRRCFHLQNQIVGLILIFVTFVCPVLDRQRVFHQKDLKCEKEVQ